VNRLQLLHEAGESIWADFLRRSLITAGGLERLLRDDAVTGVTSNPTIFGRAIAGSTEYDEAIRLLAHKGRRDPRDVFYDLALDDIAMAADIFRPVSWASTGTKNPAYSDVLYVEELIGPDTVNTMPEATLDAFRDHGERRHRLM
jgi:transaldolase/glucose-6-phosphate isomerase